MTYRNLRDLRIAFAAFLAGQLLAPCTLEWDADDNTPIVDGAPNERAADLWWAYQMGADTACEAVKNWTAQFGDYL